MQLTILKYSSFAVDPILQIFNIDINVSKLTSIIIPLGVSFFTLQGIGYIINVKMGWEKPEKEFHKFLLYITFYPKFLSGPIERSNHFLPQLNSSISFDEVQVTEGLRMVMIGFLKKIAIADQLGRLIAPVYDNIGSNSGFILWAVILVQPLYLYFDFSGYTDIAIGIAKTYGIKLVPNFDRPFLTENVTSFWRKFHMSLSFWFNDYVFKQVSFKLRRWPVYATTIAVFSTFILFGIWHGAGWNFMILGLLQAIAISFEFFTKGLRNRISSVIHPPLFVWISRFLTYLFFGISLTFFFSPNIKTTIVFFEKLVSSEASYDIEMIRHFSFLIACGLACGFLAAEFLSTHKNKMYTDLNSIWISNRINNRLLRWLIYYLILVLILVLTSMSTRIQSEFIYFQF